MPMGMPYPKGEMAFGKKKSMSEMMGVEKKGDKKPMPKAKGGKKPLPAFMMKKRERLS